MTSDADDPEAVADRLEAALARIAAGCSRTARKTPAATAAAGVDDEMAKRLDTLIARLRGALVAR